MLYLLLLNTDNWSPGGVEMSHSGKKLECCSKIANSVKLVTNLYKTFGDDKQEKSKQIHRLNFSYAGIKHHSLKFHHCKVYTISLMTIILDTVICNL